MIPVAVINLPQSTDRRSYMTAHLGALGIPFRLFDAIDGYQLSESDRARYEPTIPVGAIGCAESHLALLREIAKGDAEFVCVLEDDADLAPEALQLLDLAALQSLPRFDVLRFECRERRGKRIMIPVARFDGFDLAATYRHKIAMTGQIFSRRGAEKIVAKISYLRVALDAALFLDSYVMGLRIIETRPSLVRPHMHLPSTIGPGRKPPYTAWEILLNKHLRMRETRNIASFVAAWGLHGLFRARLS
jgi:glycosyl transferase family 25